MSVELHNLLELEKSFKVEIFRFSCLLVLSVRSLEVLHISKDMNMNVFVVAYNQRVCATKEISFLAVWVYNKEENACHLIGVKRAVYEAISCFAVSENGSYTAFGTTKEVLEYSTRTILMILYG
uniref:Uncharacterized protein n=1 Tax=Ditylenchus dipsaci TaxID=166011 RepID=A0A915CW63_9BILA